MSLPLFKSVRLWQPLTFCWSEYLYKTMKDHIDDFEYLAYQILEKKDEN